MTGQPGTRKRVAVIGAGVAGVVSAYLLQKKHDVTLFEKNAAIGGHTNTIVIEGGPDAGTPVDTGFIVCNNRTYPNFHKFLSALGVSVRPSDMSWGFACDATGLEYGAGDLPGLFAQKRNLLSPRHFRMLLDAVRWNKVATGDLAANRIGARSLGEYLRDNGFGQAFIDDHILPMGAAIWSTPPGKMLEYPAQTFVRFYSNHGLLSLEDRPQWQTVIGGSHSYLKAFLKQFTGRVITGARVEPIVRDPHGGGATIRYSTVASQPAGAAQSATARGEETFDAVVIGAHADEALALLADPTAEERRLLGAWEYNQNVVTLHTDTAVMPRRRGAWSSWNSRREVLADGSHWVSLTYDMNRLQGLNTERRYLVTLNRRGPIRREAILREIPYTHPIYTEASVATQPELPKLNGPRATWFAGAYHGYGFHEDAVKSAVAACADFGVSL